MRDSPDSFSRIRLKTGSPNAAAILLADREAHELLDHDVLAGLAREVAAQLLDRLAAVLVGVDVLLVEEHDLAVPLLQLALDDLGPDVLRLVGRELLEDARLAALVLLG